jgi:hypothetical protein
LLHTLTDCQSQRILISGELAADARATPAALPGAAAAVATRSVTQIAAIITDVNTRIEHSQMRSRTAYAGSISFLAFALGAGGAPHPDSIRSSVPSRS